MFRVLIIVYYKPIESIFCCKKTLMCPLLDYLLFLDTPSGSDFKLDAFLVAPCETFEPHYGKSFVVYACVQYKLQYRNAASVVNISKFCVCHFSINFNSVKTHYIVFPNVELALSTWL